MLQQHLQCLVLAERLPGPIRQVVAREVGPVVMVVVVGRMVEGLVVLGWYNVVVQVNARVHIQVFVSHSPSISLSGAAFMLRERIFVTKEVS